MITSCIICGSNDADVQYILGPYKIFRCRKCTFGWAEPFPSEQDILQFYSAKHHPHAQSDSVNARERRRIAQTLRRLAPLGRDLLDVGCGFGHFLDAAAQCEFQTFGVDLDAGRVDVAAQKGHQVCVGIARPGIFGGKRFDVIVLNHVIEHLTDPVGTLMNLRQLLVDKGLLYVGCPNFGCLRARITKAHFNHYSPPEHISYFTVPSVRHIARRVGFTEIMLRLTTHTLHVKELLAFFCYLNFLRDPEYRDPAARDPSSVKRFTEGRGRPGRIVIYSCVLGLSWLARPLVNLLGGEYIESYWHRG